MTPLLLVTTALAVAPANDGEFTIGIVDGSSGSGTVQEIALLDFDADGVLDLSAFRDGESTLQRGQADGTYAAPEVLPPVGVGFHGGVADLDGDGYPDHVQYDPSSAGTALHIRKGLGQAPWFGVPTVHATFNDVNALAFGDIDGDGFLDAAMAWADFQWFGGVGTSINDTHGGLIFKQKITASCDIVGIACADVNDDGLADATGIDFVQGFPWLFIARGDGTFKPGAFPGTFLGNGQWLSTGDLNGDGHDEILVSRSNGSYLDVYEFIGNGQVDVAATHPGLGLNGPLALRDVDRDGNVDVVGELDGLGAAFDGLSIGVAYGDGAFGLSLDHSLPSFIGDGARVAAADLGADGAMDLVLTRGDGWSVLTYSDDATPWEDLGGAGPNTQWGVPSVYASPLDPGSPFSVWTQFDTWYTEIPFLVIGASELGVPLFGGTLVPWPDLLVTALEPDGDWSRFDAVWPATAPTGTELFLQAWSLQPDATTANQLVGSAGLKGTSP